MDFVSDAMSFDPHAPKKVVDYQPHRLLQRLPHEMQRQVTALCDQRCTISAPTVWITDIIPDLKRSFADAASQSSVHDLVLRSTRIKKTRWTVPTILAELIWLNMRRARCDPRLVAETLTEVMGQRNFTDFITARELESLLYRFQDSSRQYRGETLNLCTQ